MHHNSPKLYNAFSLIELTVSMAIVGVIMAMLSNVLVNSIIVSQKSIARSFVREEMADISDRISNDIRDANRVFICSGKMLEAKCEVEKDGTFTWTMCTSPSGQNQICKKDSTGTVVFTSSPNVTIQNYAFDEGFDTGGNSIKRNIVLTILGDHANSAFNIKNVLRQVSISTRNYLLQASGEIIDITPPKPVVQVDAANIVYPTFTTGGVPTVVDDKLTVSSETQIVGASVNVSANFVNGTDYLDFVPVGAITGSYNAFSGVLTLSGTDSVANYQQALRSVSYRANQAAAGCVNSKQITYTVSNNSGGTSASRPISISGTVYAMPSGAQIWYKADAGTTVASGRVTRWDDQSGRSNDAFPAGTSGPMLRANVLNGKPVLDFDQASTACGTTGARRQLYTESAIAMSGNPAISQIVMADPRSGYFLNGYGTPNLIARNWGFVMQTTASFINYGLYTSTFSTQPVAVGARVVYIGKNPGPMNSTATQSNNGVLLANSGYTNLPSITSARMTIGEFQPGGNCYLWAGNLAEMMLFNRTLTTQERQDTEQYLAGRWWHSGLIPFFGRSTPPSTSCGAPPPVVTPPPPPPIVGPINLGGACTVFNINPQYPTATFGSSIPAGNWTLDVTVNVGQGVSAGDSDDSWTIAGPGINLVGPPILVNGVKSFPITTTGGPVTITVVNGAFTPSGVGICVSAIAK